MRGRSATALQQVAQPTAPLLSGRTDGVYARAMLASAAWHLTLAATYLFTAAMLLRALAGFGWRGIAVALISYLAVAGIVFAGFYQHGRQLRFGTANALTLLRAATAALFLGVLADFKLATVLASNSDVRWIMTGLAAAAFLTDGADGWLARRKGTAGDFGARFDMETDALFMLTLSLLVHASGEVGGWVLLSGLMRYLFAGAGLLWSPLAAPLLPSFRRKSVCVVQMAILIGALAPAMPTQIRSVLCAVALGLLMYSFACDVFWLAVRANPRSVNATFRVQRVPP